MEEEKTISRMIMFLPLFCVTGSGFFSEPWNKLNRKGVSILVLVCYSISILVFVQLKACVYNLSNYLKYLFSVSLAVKSKCHLDLVSV